MEAQSSSALKRRRCTRPLSCMKVDGQVGMGVYGSVFKATDTGTGERVALKMIKMEKEKDGFPVTAIREIKILKALNHENIISLYEIVTFNSEDTNNSAFGFENGAVFMVFEYMDFDLSGLMDSRDMVFSTNHVRCYAKQLLSGVCYMHKNKILHRDIKGANILVSRDNRIKIADWGLARSYYSSVQRLSNPVVTLWYRCPELLLETKKYGPEIDIWAAGCVIAEMLRRPAVLPATPIQNAILPANPPTSANQLELIYQLCGTPTGDTEERLRQCEGWEKYQSLITTSYPNRFRERFSKFPPATVDLLEKLLCMHPGRRISAEAALDDGYFWSDGGTPNHDRLPRIAGRIEAAHEFETQQKRAEERQRAAQQQQGRGGRGNPGDRGGGRSKYRVNKSNRPRPPPPPSAPASGQTNNDAQKVTSSRQVVLSQEESAFRVARPTESSNSHSSQQKNGQGASPVHSPRTKQR